MGAVALDLIPGIGNTERVTNSEIISKVRAAKGRLGDIARGSGVPEKTLHKIHYGDTTNPRMDTLDRLRDYFQSKRGRAAA